MSNTSFIVHKKKQILFMNLANLDLEDLALEIENAKSMIEKEPPGSLLLLIDVSDSQISKELSKTWKEFVAHNEPFVRATVMVGVEGIKKVIYNAVIKSAGRKDIIVKKNQKEAMTWLVHQ